MDIKNEMNTCKSKIRNYKKSLSFCTNEEEKNHLQYQLKQEEIKLESFELLFSLSKKVREKYE